MFNLFCKAQANKAFSYARNSSEGILRTVFILCRCIKQIQQTLWTQTPRSSEPPVCDCTTWMFSTSKWASSLALSCYSISAARFLTGTVIKNNVFWEFGLKTMMHKPSLFRRTRDIRVHWAGCGAGCVFLRRPRPPGEISAGGKPTLRLCCRGVSIFPEESLALEPNTLQQTQPDACQAAAH